MSFYIDTYLACADKAALEAFLCVYENVLPVQKGAAAGVNENGEPLPARGEPDLYYSCVRTSEDISPLLATPLIPIDPEEAKQVVGVFA